MCVRGDQQVEGEDYFQQDLDAPTLKETEARLIAAIETDCKQVFLSGDMDDGPPIYIKVPDWWPIQYLTAMHFCCARVSTERSKRPASDIDACQGG